MIDVGDGNGSFGHPLLLDPGNARKRPPGAGETIARRSLPEVAGVIASACLAEIIVYNIGTTAGWDKDLFVLALEDIVKMVRKPAVINISVGWANRGRQPNRRSTTASTRAFRWSSLWVMMVP